MNDLELHELCPDYDLSPVLSFSDSDTALDMLTDDSSDNSSPRDLVDDVPFSLSPGVSPRGAALEILQCITDISSVKSHPTPPSHFALQLDLLEDVVRDCMAEQEEAKLELVIDHLKSSAKQVLNFMNDVDSFFNQYSEELSLAGKSSFIGQLDWNDQFIQADEDDEEEEAIPNPFSTKKRCVLTKEGAEVLLNWLEDHLEHPYPSADEKDQLCVEAGITGGQLSNWFINARRRTLPRMKKNKARKASAMRAKARKLEKDA